MITTTLDIETIQPTWKPPSDWPDGRMPPLPYHVPCVIVWLVFDSSSMDFRLEVYRADDGNEGAALKMLAADLAKSDRIVTWNGRCFDMPLLNLRAMRHAIYWGWWRDKNHRYENYKRKLVHFDLMDLLGDQGGVRTMGFDGVCELLDLPGKGKTDGSLVSEFWHAKDGGKDDVVRYCAEDVWQTWLVYLRWAEVFMCESTARVDAITKFFRAGMEWCRTNPLLHPWIDSHEIGQALGGVHLLHPLIDSYERGKALGGAHLPIAGCDRCVNTDISEMNLNPGETLECAWCHRQIVPQAPPEDLPTGDDPGLESDIPEFSESEES